MLYKDEEEIRLATIEVVVPTEQYGNGFWIMQQMGYKGKGPIGKYQEEIIEPLQLHSQFARDKIGLRYDQHVLPM